MFLTIGDIILRVILMAGLAVGLLLIPLGLSGNFVIIGLLALYDLTHGFSIFGHTLLVFLGLAVVGEVVEALLGSAMAKRYGAGKGGMAGAFIGGIVGAIAGSALWAPIGTLIGSFIGAFLLAFLLEWFIHRGDEGGAAEGFKAGWGAFVGKFLAMGFKVSIGIGIVVWSVARIW